MSFFCVDLWSRCARALTHTEHTAHVLVHRPSRREDAAASRSTAARKGRQRRLHCCRTRSSCWQQTTRDGSFRVCCKLASSDRVSVTRASVVARNTTQSSAGKSASRVFVRVSGCVCRHTSLSGVQAAGQARALSAGISSNVYSHRRASVWGPITPWSVPIQISTSTHNKSKARFDTFETDKKQVSRLDLTYSLHCTTRSGRPSACSLAGSVKAVTR
jgi:hypothetical protein